MIALRIAAVQALKAGGTLVGDNVLDSQISAIDQTADGQVRSDQQRPFIAVYTDAAKAELRDHEGLRANGRVDLVFNCGVSVTMAETNRETGETQIVDMFPATDANLEAVIDALDVQIARTLVDPDNAWAQVFKGFIQGYLAKAHLRSSSAADNVRIAAGQTKLSVEVLPDPILGQTFRKEGAWSRFMALMAAHDHPQLPLFRQLLGDPACAPYAPFERLTGMSTREAQALRLYTHGDVARDVRVTDVIQDVEPRP